MQDEITAGIVAALTAQLTRTVTLEVARARPESLEAWELCLRARAHFVAHTNAAGRRAAEALLRTAVKKDPNYAVAWALLGSIVAFRWHVEPGRDAAADLDEARGLVEKGASLAPNDPDVLAFHGHFLMTSGRPKEALPFLEQAMHLNPNAVLNRVGLAQALCYTGRPAEALGVMEEVLRLSPRDPSAPSFAHNIAFFHFALGQYVESESWVRRALAASATNVLALLLLGEALAGQGRVEEARQALREVLRVAPETTLASQEYILRNTGLDDALVAAELKYLTIAWPPEAK
jgi:adenylate cyclase